MIKNSLGLGQPFQYQHQEIHQSHHWISQRLQPAPHFGPLWRGQLPQLTDSGLLLPGSVHSELLERTWNLEVAVRDKVQYFILCHTTPAFYDWRVQYMLRIPNARSSELELWDSCQPEICPATCVLLFLSRDTQICKLFERHKYWQPFRIALNAL